MRTRSGPNPIEWLCLTFTGLLILGVVAIVLGRSDEPAVRQVPAETGVETVTGTYEVHCVSVEAWTTASTGDRVSKALTDWLATNSNKEIVDVVHCEGGKQLVIIARRR